MTKNNRLRIQKKNIENALEVNFWGNFTQISNRWRRTSLSNNKAFRNLNKNKDSVKQILDKETKKKNNDSIRKATTEIQNSRWKVWFSLHFFSHPNFFCIQPGIVACFRHYFFSPKLEKQRRELSIILTDYLRIWRSIENTIHKRTSRIR